MHNYIFAFGAGILAIVFLAVTVENVALPLIVPGWVWAVAIPAGAVGAVWVAQLLSTTVGVLAPQLAKFTVVAGLNYAMGFGLINGFMLFAGVSSYAGLTAVRILTAIVVTTNSFFWNRWWTFAKANYEVQQKGENGIFLETKICHRALTLRNSQYFKFWIANLVGIAADLFVFNILILFSPPFELSLAEWVNVGVFLGAASGLAFKFIGYKRHVFRV